ncbi:MAG: 2,3-bisphosphoglycerate-independent phosphoglycerate mutase [Ruminococcaceae bacterium]|nr:2,3-bisphosphoglycerate-independent phosphoglycerate mutase [Oscillospiraceae bacterium]
MTKKLTMLMILDGYGYNEATDGNAVYAAKTPVMDKLLAECPNTLINASGMDVGLPEGQMGNSEVGHTNIGAGRIVYQELTRITKSIADGDFYTNDALVRAVENCKKNDSALHLFGLLSDGGVHSHITHLYAALELAKRNGLTEVYVHGFMDGRDVSPTSGIDFVKALSEKMEELGVGKIGVLSGRYYAMDRDNRWERVEKAYAALVYGEGEKNSDPVDAMQKSYDNGITDEFIVPTVITEGATIKENDSVICFNFRPDRAREITRTFVDSGFDGFVRKNGFFNLYYVCMTQYDAQMPNVDVAFKPESLENTFGEYIANKGLSQLRIAETEKYAHVTFFFNGGVEAPYKNEDRALIPSPKVATYDLQPEMSAPEVTEEVLKRIESEQYDVIILNFANCDMVGHTGVFDCAVKAVETVDECMGKVVDAVRARGGVVCITADHGNADQMVDPETKDVFTAHTTNPVPFIVAGRDCSLRTGGRLADIAPTLLDIMGIEKPAEMSGESLIK